MVCKGWSQKSITFCCALSRAQLFTDLDIISHTNTFVQFTAVSWTLFVEILTRSLQRLRVCVCLSTCANSYSNPPITARATTHNITWCFSWAHPEYQLVHLFIPRVLLPNNSCHHLVDCWRSAKHIQRWPPCHGGGHNELGHCSLPYHYTRILPDHKHNQFSFLRDRAFAWSTPCDYICP